MIAAQGEINRLKQKESELAGERTRIIEDETRVRQNLGVLNNNPSELELRKKYLAQLEKLEARLEDIKKDARETTSLRQLAETELSKKVNEFRDE